MTDTKLRCEEVSPGESGTYDWVTATVDGEDVSLDYRCTGLDIDGSDGFEDENLGEWSEGEIRDVAGSMLGIMKEDRHKIKVEYA